MTPGEDVHHDGGDGRAKRPRRAFTPEFKAEIVELCPPPGSSVGQVAHDLDLTETAVRALGGQADVDAGPQGGV